MKKPEDMHHKSHVDGHMSKTVKQWNFDVANSNRENHSMTSDNTP